MRSLDDTDVDEHSRSFCRHEGLHFRLAGSGMPGPRLTSGALLAFPSLSDLRIRSVATRRTATVDDTYSRGMLSPWPPIGNDGAVRSSGISAVSVRLRPKRVPEPRAENNDPAQSRLSRPPAWRSDPRQAIPVGGPSAIGRDSGRTPRVAVWMEVRPATRAHHTAQCTGWHDASAAHVSADRGPGSVC